MGERDRALSCCAPGLPTELRFEARTSGMLRLTSGATSATISPHGVSGELPPVTHGASGRSSTIIAESHSWCWFWEPSRSQKPDSGELCRLLCARRERPGGCRDAEQRDELAPFHSITLSARSTRPAGTSCPIALAVLRLITSSNVVGCSTGRSVGFAPLSILATIRAR